MIAASGINSHYSVPGGRVAKIVPKCLICLPGGEISGLSGRAMLPVGGHQDPDPVRRLSAHDVRA
jgi:hypothetical protein